MAKRAKIPGDWIPMRTDLDDDTSVVGVANLLKIPELHVVGCLWKLWSVASRQTASGWLPNFTLDKIDRLVGQPAFASALESVGWLHHRSDGVEIPNFEKWLSNSAKRRFLDAQRKSIVRELSANETDKNGDSLLSSTLLSSSEQNSKLEENGSHHDPPENKPIGRNGFPETAAGCAQAWCGVLTRLKNGYPADPPKDAEAKFAEMIRRGFSGKELLDEVFADRNRNEHHWQFEQRLQRNRDHASGTNSSGRGVGPSSRVRAPAGKYDGIGKTVDGNAHAPD